MSRSVEWHLLREQTRTNSFDPSKFDCQFYRRLVQVLLAANATEVDQLLAFRDALLAAENPAEATLVAPNGTRYSFTALSKTSLKQGNSGQIRLGDESEFDWLDLGPVYRLEGRRYIHKELIDPALKKRLQDPLYTHYNGKAQQLAVRLAITSKHNSTLIVNLPTGCGKTLVAHASSLFAPGKQLTVVVVPTIGLAIEQGRRAKKLFITAGLDHGGLYYWHGEQSKVDHDDIKGRIREQRQRVLFCSPEAACRSLLPVLFQAASNASLNALVIDEAHVVDQWGAEFRPYFQIIASLVRSLREESPKGLKCILMSATYSPKCFRVLEDLFAVPGQDVVHIFGSFLRPEIQFAVRKVPETQHQRQIVKAVTELPKPLITYVLYPDHAELIHNALLNFGLLRIALFTGNTPPREREEILTKWDESELDIIVATSAFGLGMDKSNVRSVIHAAVPENLDRFYQEVGRGGRDGLACQSLVLYHKKQAKQAVKLNNERLITVELGYEKWKAMWDHGASDVGGSRRVHLSTLRADQSTKTDSNDEWNWRTLLLMQRAGLIRIEMNPPKVPAMDPAANNDQYKQCLQTYFDRYYDNVSVVPLTDSPRVEVEWKRRTAKQREYEKCEKSKSVQVLLDWLKAPNEKRLCDLLLSSYTIDDLQPEIACGGCPVCLEEADYIETPTVGSSVNVEGAQFAGSWGAPLTSFRFHQYIYFPRGTESTKRLIRKWRGWIERLIEMNAISAIRAEEAVLDVLASELKTQNFWMGNAENAEQEEETMFWPQLVLKLETKGPAPELHDSDSVKLLVAPEDIADVIDPNRRWWNSVAGPISLDTFLRGIQT